MRLRVRGPRAVLAFALAGGIAAAFPVLQAAAAGATTGEAWVTRGDPDGVPVVELALRVGRGPIRPVRTTAATVTQLLQALGIRLGVGDRVRPAVGTLYRGMRLRIVRGDAPPESPATGPAHGSVLGIAAWRQCGGASDAASFRGLPDGARVTVTDVTGRAAVAVIIDHRGPDPASARIIDLCSASFARLAPLSQGIAAVRITW